MHSFIPSLLLAAFASTAASFPSYHGPVNFKRDSPNSIPFPTGTDIPTFGDNGFKVSQTDHRGSFGTGSPQGTGWHSRHHHHQTGPGGHHSASATLAVRQISESDASFTGTFPTSFPMPTGTGGMPGCGFPSGTGFGGGIPTGGLLRYPKGVAHASGHGGQHPSGSALPSGGFGTVMGAAHPTGCGGKHSGSQSGDFASPTGAANFKQNFPSGSGTFPSMSLPSGTGSGGGAPTGGFGGGSGSASSNGGMGGQQGQGRQSQQSQGSASASGDGRKFPRHFPSGSAGPSGGFPSMSIPTGTGFGSGAPTGSFGAGSASPISGMGGQRGQSGEQHTQGSGIGFGGGFPAGTGISLGGFGSGPTGSFPTGGFLMPTGGSGPGSPSPFPTTFHTSVVTPSSATL